MYDIGSEDPEEESESEGLMVFGMSKRYCPGLRFHLLKNKSRFTIGLGTIVRNMLPRRYIING